MAEMMGISTKTKARGRPKTAPVEQQQQYYEEEPQEYDDFSEESD